MARPRVHVNDYERHKAGREKWQAKRRALLAELKDTPCVECGGRFHPAAMDFRHRDPSSKYRRYTAWTYVLGTERLLEEVAKCDVICANCHRTLHAEERAREREVMRTRKRIVEAI